MDLVLELGAAEVAICAGLLCRRMNARVYVVSNSKSLLISHTKWILCHNFMLYNTYVAHEKSRCQNTLVGRVRATVF